MKRWIVLCLVALLAACGDSCSCGGESGAETEGAKATAVDPMGVAGSGEPSAGASAPVPRELSPELLAMRNQLAPNEDSGEREKLERAAAKIDGTADLGDPLPAERFQSALPDRVGNYRAEGAAQTAVTPAASGTAPIAARRYRSGASLMNVKITDTADAPEVRRELAEQLAMVGNEPTGNQRGRVNGAIPGVLAYHEKARASRAMALVAGRFLVEVMVEQTEDKDAAWRAIEAIDVKVLKR